MEGGGACLLLRAGRGHGSEARARRTFFFFLRSLSVERVQMAEFLALPVDVFMIVDPLHF